MSAQTRIPEAFYEAARRMHAMQALTQAMLHFADSGPGEQSGALQVIAGLLDAQDETVRALGELINAAESELLQQGLNA